MAFRVAELLERGEDDESTRAEITETILKVWGHRWSWPEGWPPVSVRPHLGWLLPQHHNSPSSEDTRAQFMKRVANALSDEYRFWLWASSSAAGDADDDSWADFEPWTPWTERQFIRRLNELTRLADARRGDSTGDEDPQPDMETEARNELNSLLRTRRSLLPIALKLSSVEPAPGDPLQATTPTE
jgi:hypothetical protein